MKIYLSAASALPPHESDPSREAKRQAGMILLMLFLENKVASLFEKPKRM